MQVTVAPTINTVGADPVTRLSLRHILMAVIITHPWGCILYCLLSTNLIYFSRNILFKFGGRNYLRIKKTYRGS